MTVSPPASEQPRGDTVTLAKNGSDDRRIALQFHTEWRPMAVSGSVEWQRRPRPPVSSKGPGASGAPSIIIRGFTQPVPFTTAACDQLRPASVLKTWW